MPMMICERCSKETCKPEKCEYCGKSICRACLKSAKRIQKITRLAICKSCWSDMGKRSKFKAVK